MTKTSTALARAEPPDAASERVLRGAARLFREKGFAGTTVREIAAAAGMLPGSLHYRYKSKDEILLALMERGVQAAIDVVREAVEGEPDPVERLRLGIRAHLKLLLSGEDAVYVLLFDWRALQGQARREMVRLRDRYEAFWEAMLKQALAQGRGRKHVDSKLLRLFGFGAVNWVATWYRPGLGYSPEQVADAFFTLFAFGLIREQARPRDVEALFAAVFKKGGRRGAA